ncbi:hypothetical protein GGR51DRAFT_566630 [Nemania sp. FL0031]|nr:hypothetical protein GGR51DRAFT_566630 [Nemania sp. FL0031]
MPRYNTLAKESRLVKFFFAINIIFCSLLQSILSLYVYLFGKVRQAYRTVYGQVCPKRRTNNIRSCIRENRRFAEAWKNAKDSSVVFVTIEVHESEGTLSGPSEVGLSWWSPGSISDIQAHYWILENEIKSVEIRESTPSKFLYGVTGQVSLDDLVLYLTDLFTDLNREFDTVYLVGFGVEMTIQQLERLRVIPKNFVILDTKKIWRAQHQDTTADTFKKAILEIPQLEGNAYALGNSGNIARVGIELLQYLGQATKIVAS